MPFDYRMKHEGEPPARLVANMRLRFREKGFSPSMAELFAPIMSSDDDMDKEFFDTVGMLIDVLRERKVPPEEAMAVVKEALEELMNEETGGDDTAFAAFYGQPRTAKKERGNLPLTVLAKLQPDISVAPPRAEYARAARSDRSGHMMAALSDGLQARMDRTHKPTVGREFARSSLGEIAMQCAQMAGHRPAGLREGIRMAQSASDFPLVLADTLSKSVARRMEQVPPALLRAAHEIEARDYRQGNLVSLTGGSMPQEINENGEIKHISVTDSGERKPAPRDFGVMVGLSNKAVYNDDLGVFEEIGREMVKGAIERQRAILLEPLVANNGLGHLMMDDKTVFHADHKNLAPEGGPLSVDTLSTARLALRTQRGKTGEYFATEPWALVVPPQLETVAQKVLQEIAATKTDDVNPFSGKLELIVEVGLTDPDAWYLIGNPSQSDGLAYSYLDGQAAPQVESRTGWDTLGTEFRLVWALDAKFVSYASWFKNPGK